VRTPVLLILLLATIANAATVTLTPQTVYETTSIWQTIDVDNYQGSSIVNSVGVDSSSLEITDADDYLGWTTAHDATSASWNAGNIETNVKSVLFEYQVQAPNITSDKNVSIIVSLDSSSITYDIRILNDASGPIISSVSPDDYAAANTSSQAIIVEAIDPETGVSKVTYTWDNCSGGLDTTIVLGGLNGTYNGIADFNGYAEGDQVCYTVEASNNAGETSTLTGQLIFDGTAPQVSIISPTTFATENQTFSFTATDNLAGTLKCQLEIDNTLLGIVNATNGSVTTANYDLTLFDEGSQTWSVNCQDGVGLSATHAQAVILDTQGPVITYNSNSYLLRTQSTQVSSTVTDNIGLANVSVSFDGNALNLSQSGNDFSSTIQSDTLGTKVLVISATDNAGHTSTLTQNITVIPNHQLTLSLSPSQTTKGKNVVASGTLTTDGNTSSSSVLIRTPDANITTTKNYNVTFDAPIPGTYTIVAEYVDGEYTYTAQATLTVQSTDSQEETIQYSSGTGVDWTGSGQTEPTSDSDSGGSNAVIPDEPVQEPETPEEPVEEEPAEYEPIDSSEPRSAFTPKATGVFSLGDTIKWISILIVLGGIIGLGVYTYRKRPKSEDPMSWDGYFR